MSALIEELGALFEILEVCKDDLKKLLICDHPPSDLLERIDQERSNIAAVKHLIVDLKAHVALKELHKYVTDEFSMTRPVRSVCS
jgi:hypothetical protein